MKQTLAKIPKCPASVKLRAVIRFMPILCSLFQGSIPLHLSAENGHSEVVSLLLSKSTVQLHVKNKTGRTALHLAAANGHRELVSQLIGQGADINNPDEVGFII
jgi:ankyrin repeat protein